MAPLDLEVSPRPDVDVAMAARLAEDLFGVDGRGPASSAATRTATSASTPRAVAVVLKVANRSWGRAAIEAQNAALLHVAAADAGFGAPVPMAARRRARPVRGGRSAATGSPCAC